MLVLYSQSVSYLILIREVLKMRQLFLICLLSTFTFLIFVNETYAAPISKKELLIELTGKDSLKVSETKLYGDIVIAYQRNDEIALISKVEAMMTRFPNGRFTDNAIYLAGKFQLENRNYAKALKYFNKIFKSYPMSDRVVAAQYAKGVTYKQIRLNKMAKQTFLDLRKKYPGSPEFFLAEAEIHSLN